VISTLKSSLSIKLLFGLLLLTVFGIILLGLAFSFITALSDFDKATGISSTSDSEDAAAFYVFFSLCSNAALAAAITVIVTQVFALTGYALFNKVLVIFYIILTACSVIVCVVCIAIPAVSAAILNTGCEAWRASETDYSTDSDYELACVEIAGRFNAVTAFMAILTVLSFVQSVIGCVCASSIGRKDVVVATYTTGVPVTTQQTVVVAAQPGAQPYPGQPVAYAVGQPVAYPQQQQQQPGTYVAYPQNGQVNFYPPPPNGQIYPPPTTPQ